MSAAETSQKITEQRLAIDKMEQDFNKRFFRLLNKTAEFKGLTYPTIAALNTAIDQHKNDSITTVALIVHHLSLLKYNYDHPDIYRFIQLLLDNNELSTALSLIQSIEQQADITTITHSHYLLANFYFQRHQWQKSLQYLQEDGLDLATDVYQHRLLIKGFALQKQMKHSKAQKEYEKIPVTSQYYHAAQFNIALVNLRQGWWSGAHNIIKALHKQSDIQSNEHSLNRLHITLGYSLLKKGYYRSAKDTFHKVGVDSDYTNQALLGIALTAAQQDDYVGALNASRLLKNKKVDDLPVDEAHLLMPFFYEQSQQWQTASIGYLQASAYYQQKIESVAKQLSHPVNLKNHPIKVDTQTTLDIEQFHLNLSEHYPQYFFENNKKLMLYQTWVAKLKNKKLTRQFNKLKQQYTALSQKMVTAILQIKQDNLTSYLDQTRFGIARLYDNTAK